VPQPILILLDYIEKIILDLDSGIKRGSLRKTSGAYEKLTELSNYLKELLPEDFIDEHFKDFDRHMRYIGIFLRKKDFNWIRSNFDDIKKEDFPNIKKKIYDLPKEEETPKKRVAQLSNKVFIVHGRDHKPLKELKAMLTRFGLNPIVLHEKASGSRTIVEKLEKYSDVGYTFVILTPDDVGGDMGSLDAILSYPGFPPDYEDIFEEPNPLMKRRARQNVILEFGYFIGKLNRDRVCCLHKGDVELPSDMHGIVYVPFKDSVKEARDMIIEELTEAGYEIKM